MQMRQRGYGGSRSVDGSTGGIIAAELVDVAGCEEESGTCFFLGGDEVDGDEVDGAIVVDGDEVDGAIVVEEVGEEVELEDDEDDEDDEVDGEEDDELEVGRLRFCFFGGIGNSHPRITQRI